MYNTNLKPCTNTESERQGTKTSQDFHTFLLLRARHAAIRQYET